MSRKFAVILPLYILAMMPLLALAFVVSVLAVIPALINPNMFTPITDGIQRRFTTMAGQMMMRRMVEAAKSAGSLARIGDGADADLG